MAKTRMPRDDNGTSIQILRYRPGGYHVVDVTSNISINVDVMNATRVIILYATTAV